MTEADVPTTMLGIHTGVDRTPSHGGFLEYAAMLEQHEVAGNFTEH